MFLAAFEDDFLNKEAGDGQVDGAYGNQTACLFAMKGFEAFCWFGAVGMEDEVKKGSFFLFQLLSLLFFAKVVIDAFVMLTFLFAQVENFKAAVVLPGGF